jgi:prevent-host-death family protein
MSKLTATEASRGFSELLNRVGAGERVEIVRSGATVAVLSPAHVHIVPGQRLLELLAELPALDEQFADDVATARERVGSPPSIDW